MANKNEYADPSTHVIFSHVLSFFQRSSFVQSRPHALFSVSILDSFTKIPFNMVQWIRCQSFIAQPDFDTFTPLIIIHTCWQKQWQKSFKKKKKMSGFLGEYFDPRQACSLIAVLPPPSVRRRRTKRERKMSRGMTSNFTCKCLK